MRKTIRFVVSVLLLLAGVLWGIELRFGNPGYTETELILAFWREYAVITLFVFVAMYGLSDLDGKHS